MNIGQVQATHALHHLLTTWFSHYFLYAAVARLLLILAELHEYFLRTAQNGDYYEEQQNSTGARLLTMVTYNASSFTNSFARLLEPDQYVVVDSRHRHQPIACIPACS